MNVKTNLVLDVSIFTVFLISSSPSLTGNSIHEWLGLAFAMAIVVHLLLHWNWLVKVSLKFFKNLFHQSRLQYIVDLLFFIAMTATFFSGLMISKTLLPALGIQLRGGGGWKSIHKLAGDAAVILFGLHFALHWKWIVKTLGRYVFTPLRNQFRRADKNILADQPVQVDDEK